MTLQSTLKKPFKGLDDNVLSLGGQLRFYLRLVGAKVPPSYGPSGDESPFA